MPRKPVGPKKAAGLAWRQLAREMKEDPNNYAEFFNNEHMLPKANKNQYYIEGTVDVGIKEGEGQYRVVCLVGKDHGKIRVLTKYWTRTHYGTGSDVNKEHPFREFG